MTNSEIAIEFIEKYGWELFPCIWDKGHKPLVKWKTKRIKKDQQFAEWVAHWVWRCPEVYFCVATKQSGIIVIDVDNKNGKAGSDTLFDLQLKYKVLPDTLSVSTPGGGLHFFFKGSCPQGVEKLGKGIDLPFMVPLPGSKVAGKGVYSLEGAGDVLDLPAWVSDLAIANSNAPKNNPAFDGSGVDYLDQDSDVRKAKGYLQGEAPKSIENDGGDNTCYFVAASVRDLGISMELCSDLMLDNWNEECSPPWDIEELNLVISHVYEYASNVIGAKSIISDFGEPIGVKPAESILNTTTVVFEENDEVEEIEESKLFTHVSTILKTWQPPQWLVKKYIEKSTITLIYGESGAFKSFLALDMALSIATGRDWAGQKVSKGSVFYIAGEGHSGISRRVKAWEKLNEVEGLADCPFLVSKRALHIDNVASVREIVGDMKSVRHLYGPPKLVVIDTLATAFGGGDENSTKDMTSFLNFVAAGLRDSLGCAVLIVHHSGHSVKNRPRGAYALMAGVDAHYQVDLGREEFIMCLRRPGKIKDGEPSGDTWFSMETVKVGVSEELDSITSLVPKYNNNFTEKEVEKKGKNSTDKPVHQGLNQNIIISILSLNEGSMADLELREAFKQNKESTGVIFNRSCYIKAHKALVDKGMLLSVDGCNTLA